MTAFSLHFVQKGPIPKEIGRIFKQAETRRYVADYEDEPIDLADAEAMIADAQCFITEIRAKLQI